jgi:uncharacterized membrane protein
VSTPYEGPAGDKADDQRSVGELLRELSEETSTLVRQEVQLAKAELSAKVKQAGKGAVLLGAAAVMGLALLGAFTAFLILVLDLVLAAWLAALVVTVVYAVIVAVLALAGRSALRKATPVAPEQTVETVKEDVEWAKNQARSAKR